MSTAPSPACPLEAIQVNARLHAFRDKVSTELVKALAARHNDNKFCRVSRYKNIDYTYLSVDVTFPDDEKEWRVRIPVPTTVRNDWDLVRSEAATINYVQQHTTIPVPSVHAYGKDEILTTDPETTQSYIIIDRSPGTPAHLQDIEMMTREKRARFLSQYADVLAQLQKLKFPTTGSLYPDESDDTKTHIGPSVSGWDSFLSNRDGEARVRPPLNTAWDSIQHHLAAVHGWPDLKRMFADRDPREEIRREMFAMDAVSRDVEDANSSFWREDAGFTLVRGPDPSRGIFIDSQGNIQAITDWAWTEIVPRQLCLPAQWILNVKSDAEQREEGCLWSEFLKAVTPEHAYHEHLQYYLDNESRLPFAAILRAPDLLATAYFCDKFWEAQHDHTVSYMLKRFFEDPEHKAELVRRLAIQKDYLGDLIDRHLRNLDKSSKECEAARLTLSDMTFSMSRVRYYQLETELEDSPLFPASPESSPLSSVDPDRYGDTMMLDGNFLY
ncbi:Protein kinase-like domain [Cordyceps javanica]|uniref:Protein kinase-like domain n=1 Tax=Cordyceps javanica TaxID=43265 RepID=A0A545VBZ1_9HYPO|nr:Protein kinase-like domain [Cordyceps javanica]TQW11056.1 Protein kinase-like domain [Cordyceps javanica]